MYKNSEGYNDPTAGKAVSMTMKAYKAEQKEKFRRCDEIKNRKKVYVISKYAGDIEKNVKAAQENCKYVIANKCIPVASHLLYPQLLDMEPDGTETEEARELGTQFGLALLAVCDEAWIFPNGQSLSDGMKREIQECIRRGIPRRMIREEHYGYSSRSY